MSDSKNPRVSFVVPTYNYGRYLAQAIDSLLAQTFRELEVIVIDDGSTDNTVEVLRKYEAEPRIRTIRHEQNRGHIATFNEGIQLARGEFVGLVSPDDYLLGSSGVERQVRVFDSRRDVGFVYPAFQEVDAAGKLLRVCQPWPTDHVVERLVEVQRLFGSPHLQNYIPASGTLVRRKCHDMIGVYDPRLGHTGDWDLWLRLAARYSVGYVAEPLVAYRLHQANMSFDRNRGRDKVAQLLLTASKAFDTLPADAPASLRGSRRRVLEQIVLLPCWQERHGAQVRGSWNALIAAAGQAPWILTRPAFYAAFTRTMLLTLLGTRLYTQLSERRRRIFTAEMRASTSV